MPVRNVVLSSALVSVFVLAGATPAFAGDPSTFGTHVRDCAQTMSFSGSHNPGMHRGATGWDGTKCR